MSFFFENSKIMKEAEENSKKKVYHSSEFLIEAYG